MDKLVAGSAPNRAFLGYSACAVAGCLWGTGFYFGKIALAEMGVNDMVLYRFLFAAVALLPFAFRQRAQLAPREWRTLLIGAFLGVPLQFLVQFHGLSLTTVSHASLMVGTLPVILAAGATLFAGETLNALGWLALIGSSFGATLIVWGVKGANAAGGPSLIGDLLVIVSLVVALGWILINKSLMEAHPPLVITTYGMLSGTAMLLVWVLFRSGLPPVAHVSLRAWLALAASGVLCTATTTFLWNWGIHQVPASRAGVFLNAEPALGSVLGVKLMGDHLGPFAWVGGALILIGALILTTRMPEPEVMSEVEAMSD